MTTLETKLAEALNKLHSWLVCWPITTPEDMAQSFPEMGEIAGEALAEYEREKAGQIGPQPCQHPRTHNGRKCIDCGADVDPATQSFGSYA